MGTLVEKVVIGCGIVVGAFMGVGALFGHWVIYGVGALDRHRNS